ncbi:MAG: hypothetical protein Q4P13_00875 [Psychrobacter sp.]|nr:hypothetical protein [Psychrobacter sp.]
MIKAMGMGLVILLALYIIAGVGLYFAQRHLIYYPQPFTQERFPELTLETADGLLTAICVNTDASCQPIGPRAIIYFGGNAEAVIHSASLLQRIIAPEISVYLVNYRGFGRSAGSPSEPALIQDALAVYDHIHQQLQSTPTQSVSIQSGAAQPLTIDVIGRSIGTGVASALASQRSVRKLALITPFDSLEAVAQEKFRLYPLRLLLKDSFCNDQRATQIDSQVLLLVAGQDEMIPPRHAERLKMAFNRPIDYTTIDSATHNDIMTYSQAQERLQQFMSD